MANFFDSHVRISMDLLNTRNKENQFVNTCLSTHSRFVIDNTNPTRLERKRYIDLAKKHSYEIIGYYFSSSVGDSIKRNKMRSGKEKIPEAGIRGCYSKLEIPKWDEGYDKLFFVKPLENGFEVNDWDNEI